jgi:hypothetical protein
LAIFTATCALKSTFFFRFCRRVYSRVRGGKLRDGDVKRHRRSQAGFCHDSGNPSIAVAKMPGLAGTRCFRSLGET